MADPLQILWTPAGVNLDSAGSRRLVDVSDGDTPNIRMPIRMLSVDTPEVTANSEAGAGRVDERFLELAQWMRDGVAPVRAQFRDYILPKLESGQGGTLQFVQGQAASQFLKDRSAERLARPGQQDRNLFVRVADEKFDRFGRLLAYVAPSYSRAERDAMTRAERATFNFDLVQSGHGAPFVIFPSIPGELDLPMFVEAAAEAEAEGRGQYSEALQMPGYEYRMCEKLHGITRRIVEGEEISFPDRLAWRSRYCADMRDRQIFGPEAYMAVPPAYRLWFWPEDVQRAIGMLNLTPAASLTS